MTSLARTLLGAAGATMVATGAVFFGAPNYSADNFPWNVSPFVAMTIGGWAVGTGLIALSAWRTWSFDRVYPLLLFVWSFAVFELIVVIAFLGVLRTDHWLTWPYLLSLLLGAASAVVGLPALWAARREILVTAPVPAWIRLVFVAFVLVLGGLALVTLLVVADTGRIFPEPLSAFTTRAFSAFFGALLVGGLPLLLARDVRAPLEYMRAGLYLIVPITLAALLNLGSFDFGGRPGGLVYIGAYVAAGVVALYSTWWRGRRSLPA
jgi:hypothetical protein